MQKVIGLDEMYLSLDTRRTIGHVAGIAIFQPRTEPRDELAFLRERVAERMDKVPLLRWHLRAVPGNLGYRQWVDGEVDLLEHIHRVRIGGKGTERQFHAALDRIMADKLDRSRPMWSLYVVEGMAGGGYAYVLKMTHGLVDGTALWWVLDQLSDAPSMDLPASPPRREPRFGSAEMLVRGVAGLATMPLRGLRLQAETAWWAGQQLREHGLAFLVDSAARIVPGELSRPIAKRANRRHPDSRVASLVPTLFPPHSAFNGTVTKNLAIETLDVSLTDLRRVGKLVDGTINDAILAITAGAIRRYQAEHGGIPTRPLVAAAPVSWRTGQEKERWSNQVFMLFLPLGTHVEEPLARLRYAKKAADTAKVNWDGLPNHLTRRASEFMPVPSMVVSTFVTSMLPGRIVPKLYNVSVSNVRGPAVSPQYGGASIDRYVVYGFLPPGCGMLLGGQSIGDRMTLTATVCTDIVTDHAELPALLQQSLDELLSVADTVVPTTRGPRSRRRA